MKKTTLLFFTLLSIAAHSQQKTTGDMALGNSIPLTANFTLDNGTSLVTLVLKGPSDRWFGLGIGVVDGFGMSDGDAVVFTTATTPNNLTDRNFIGTQQPPQDTSQDWTTVSNVVNGTVRTLTLTRSLTTGDANDYQMPYATTNNISIGGVRALSATYNITGHGGGGNAGFASANFTTLGVDDLSLNATSIFPNPAKGKFTVKAKTNISKINIYSQTGAFVKTMNVSNGTTEVTVSTDGLSSGVYLLELQNDTDKAWKKLIVE